MGVSLSQDIGNGLGTCTDGFLRSIQVDDVIFKVHIHNPAAVIFDRQFNEIQKGLIFHLFFLLLDGSRDVAAML